MFSQEVTVGKIPILAVVVALLIGQGFGLYVWWVYTTKKPIVQIADVVRTTVVEKTTFDPEYHKAIGQRFLWNIGNWNRWNLARQMSVAMGMGDEQVVTALRGRYLQYGAMAERLRVVRRSVIEDAAFGWADPDTGVSQHRYLVRTDEWWSGTPQDPRWEDITLQMKNRSSRESGYAAMAVVIGMKSRDLTEAIMAERGLTVEQLRRELETDRSMRVQNQAAEPAVTIDGAVPTEEASDEASDNDLEADSPAGVPEPLDQEAHP